jgi:hypothetical protein
LSALSEPSWKYSSEPALATRRHEVALPSRLCSARPIERHFPNLDRSSAFYHQSPQIKSYELGVELGLGVGSGLALSLGAGEAVGAGGGTGVGEAVGIVSAG